MHTYKFDNFDDAKYTCEKIQNDKDCSTGLHRVADYALDGNLVIINSKCENIKKACQICEINGGKLV